MEIRSSVDEACRLCLRGEGKISVFDDDSKARTITPENIYDCVSVKITKDDKLPKGICESCVKSVESWCSFKNTCDETQKTLQGWLLSDCAGQVSKKEIVCFPTQKENIKNSSCNTYKITDRINCNDKGHVPCISDSPPDSYAKDLDTKLYPEGRPEVKSNVNGLANVECNGPSLPRTNESNSPTDFSSERVELPKVESQITLEDASSKTASDWGSLLSKPVDPFDISDSNSPLEDNIHTVNSNPSVNILNETNQPSFQGDSNILNCKYDVKNDKESKYDITNDKESKDDITNDKESKYDISNDKESKYDITNDKESKYDVTSDEDSKCDIINYKESKYDVTNNKENSNDKIFSSSEVIEANSKDGSDYSLQRDQQFNDESISESDNATNISLEKNSESSLDNCLLNTDEFSSSSCKEETVHCTNFNMLDQRNFAGTNLSSGMKAPNVSESLIENNNSIENSVNSAVMDLLSEIQEKIESLSSSEENKHDECVGSYSPKTSEIKTHSNENSKTSSNATLVDSDKENSTPNLSFDANSNRSDDSKDKQFAYIGNENSVEGEGFSEIRIESTSTLTTEHEFTDEVNACTDQQDLHHSNDNSDSPQPPTENEEDINNIDGLPSQISKSQLESSNIEGSNSSQQNIPLENSSLASEAQSGNLQNCASIQNQSKQPSDSNEARSVSPSTAEQEPMENSLQSLEQSSEDSQLIPPLSVNIKQEPIEPPPEEDTPTERVYNIRVKSEFSTFDYEEEINEYETIDNVTQNCSSDLRGATQDSLNTECHICHRRYSSVSNYLKHLQTKVHLYNASIGESSRDEQHDDNSRDSPMLRSRLSGEPLNSSVDDLSITQSFTPSTSTSPRKKPEHCDLCNTSFGYISELRRHLLSKKHRDNERYLKETQSPPAKKPCLSSSPTQNENRSIFICPIEKCYFSCVKGASLLTHMKIHGIEQPTDIKPDENVNSKPKLSARQQDLLKKEAEKRKQQQQQQIQLQQQQQQQLQQKQLLQQQQQQQIQLQLQLQQGLEEEECVDEYPHVPPGYARDYECEGCHKTFFRESGLRKHTHYCNAFSQNEYVEQNKQEEASREAPDNTKSQKMHCPLCDLSFASRSVFFSHVQIYHKGSNLESGLLKLHKKASVMQVSNKLRVNNKKGLGFVCNICGKKFNLLSSLNFHLKSHTVSVKHICRICKEGFSSRKAFMEHCRLHFLKPGSKETLCHKCFKVFKTRSELYYHRKNDMCSIKLKIYSCSMCQHSFKEPSALEEHKVRFHSESIDMSEDDVHSSSVGELYDDSFIPMNPLSLLSPTNENLGTLPNSVNVYSNKSLPTQSNKNLQNYNNKNPNIMSNKVSSMSYNPKPPSKSPFHCEICVTDYATKQTLRKHIKKFHILNLPYMGSKRRGALRKGNVLQANAMKQWKCRHCKTGFGSRKMLVLHLKKCQYNVLDLAKGMCLQCGKWCESGKTRICRFCLPDLSKAPKSHPSNFIEESRLQRLDYQGFSGYKKVKQEFVGHQLQDTSNEEYLGVMNPGVHYLDFSSQQRPQGAYSTDKFLTTIKTEGKDIPQTNTSAPRSNSNVQRSTYKQGNQQIISSNIKLMKCPIGNKYFRNEMIMIKHYSQCDGSCENRCSHCRKMFNSPKEYRNHLVNSKCFGPKRTQARMKYPSFGSKRKYTRKQEISITALDPNSTYQTPRSNVDESIDRIPDNSSDVTVDMSTLEGSISEENSIGPESSISISTNRVLEEKSLKIGRICTLCDKVINMQRAIYRHVYGCFKIFMLSQESVTCRKCCKTFSKLNSMKENTAAMRQHVLDCHFIPYYVGEGLAEDGSPLNTPPPLLCYVCSFGFTSHISLQKHIKDHRARKDETNNVVLQLEEELLSDERLTDENKKFSLYLEVKNSNAYTVRTGRVLSLQDSPPDSSAPRPQSSGRKIFQCDKCSRNFTNRNKFLRHKKVHGIVKQSVLHEVTENIIDFMNENAPSNNLS